MAGERRAERGKLIGMVAGQRIVRVVLAVGLPAAAFILTFPFLHGATTVYNEPSNSLAAFMLVLLLTFLPGLVIALLVRNNWVYPIGVALNVVAAVVVAIQIATTDDGQAGLAVIGLPVYMGVVAMISIVIDAVIRARARSAP
jgi:hypothetical protein